MDCEFCQHPEFYGLLQAQQIYTVSTYCTKGGNKLIHPPEHPVTGFYGVLCKNNETITPER